MRKFLRGALAKPLLWGLCLLPVMWLVFAALTRQLGANPAEALVRSTGDWTLRFLCLVLLVSPLRVMAKMPELARFRRMVGLYVYFYALLHLLSYSGFDMDFDVADIARDIVKRPFILVGFCALMLLTALALTSFNRVIRQMGARRWQRLHQAVYGIAALAMLHFFWMRSGKKNYAEVWLYGIVLSVLLGWRLARYIGNKGLWPRRILPR